MREKSTRRIKLYYKENVLLIKSKNRNMKPNASTIIADNYFGLLRNLSKETKIELIAKLSSSITEDNVSDDDTIVDKYFGAFISDKTAEQIIKEIRESRTFNRTIEAFWI